MRRTRRIGYTKAELDRLYERTESWTDPSKAVMRGPDVEFVMDDPQVLYVLPIRTAEALSRLARRRRTTPERLVHRWVKEKLAEA
jgi:hypothetical protein